MSTFESPTKKHIDFQVTLICFGPSLSVLLLRLAKSAAHTVLIFRSRPNFWPVFPNWAKSYSRLQIREMHAGLLLTNAPNNSCT